MGETEFTRLKKEVQKNREEIALLNEKIRNLTGKKPQQNAPPLKTKTAPNFPSHLANKKG
jgi:outer membrane protein TolC